MLKMMLLHPNLATNARAVFKLCSLLITNFTYIFLTALWLPHGYIWVILEETVSLTRF